MYDKAAPIIGLDIGGTNIRIGIVDLHNHLLSECEVVPSTEICGFSGPIDGIAGIIRRHLASYRGEAPIAIAIGIPGSVSSDNKTAVTVPNLFATDGSVLIHNLNIGDALEQRFHIPVFVNKDVNLLLLHDACDLISAHHTIVGCYLGTGIGGAAIVNGMLLRGSSGFAMDIGHLPMYRVDKVCGCGKIGCAETVSSGIVLKQLWQDNFSEISMRDLFIQHKDHPLLLQFVKDCAYVPASLLTVFAPDVLVLGGGIIEMPAFPRDLLEESIRDLTGRAVQSVMPTIIYSERLPQRGVIGASIFARQLLMQA